MKIKLLGDIRDIFETRNEQFITSEDLVAELHDIEESPWGEWKLTYRKLSDHLREFDVRPGRDSSGKRRGYRFADLSDAFSRYLRHEVSEPSATADEQDEAADAWGSTDGSKRQMKMTCQDVSTARMQNLTGLTGLTDTEAHNSSDSCRFCNAYLPSHMTSQRKRGYCNTAACLERARINV